MGGRKIKLIFSLIIFFAGYATAVYTLMPAPDESLCADGTSLNASAFQAGEFTNFLNSSIHKCIDISKEAASRTAELIKQKIKERQAEAKNT